MNNPFFSIVIPTHNRPHFLDRALSSVVAQDFKDYELIVVNDGSHLSYDELFAKYTGQIQRIVVHEVSKGVSAARNSGIMAARGKWVTFLDDDDEFTGGFLHRMHRLLLEAQENVGFSWASVMFQTYDENGNKANSSYRNYEATYPSERKLYGSAITVGTGFGLTIKRECFEKMGMFDTSFQLGEDTEMVLRLLANGYKPVICTEVGVTIHQHSTARDYQNLNERVKTRVFERLAEKHLDFMKGYPEILSGILGWNAGVSYFCGDFAGGDRLLFPMFRAAPFSFCIWKRFITALVLRSFFRLVPKARFRVA